MIITGGRGRNISEILTTEVYDTEYSEWKKFQGLGLYRHSCFTKENYLYIYGGFDNTSPNTPIDKMIKIDLLQYFSSHQSVTSKLEEILTSLKENSIAPSLDKKIFNNTGTMNMNVGNYSLKEKDVSIGGKESNNPVMNNNILLKNKNLMQIDTNISQNKQFRLANKAVVVRFGENPYNDTGLFRKVSIDKLQDEAKRIGFQNVRSQLNVGRVYNEDLINKFIDNLLRPFDWYTNEVDEIHNNLPFTSDEIESLIYEAVKLITRDPTLIKLRSPVKIFGNLLGQYNDLMRFFESYGHPSDDTTMGDIHMLQYIFLGDFSDRGNHSLEVILLLLALKVINIILI